MAAASRFPLEPFARYCLMHGVDQLGYLLAERCRDHRVRAAAQPRVMKAKITVLGGDGIGPEVTREGVRALQTGCRSCSAMSSSSTERDFGGIAIDNARRSPAGGHAAELPGGRCDPAGRDRRPEVVGAGCEAAS